MRSVKWRLQSNGWLRVDFEYTMEGDHDFLGVSFDYPEEKVKGMRWLGRGPYRVWKNRRQGMIFNVWTKPYNDTRTGVSWLYPEFKGYHAGMYWAVLDTTEGPITMLTPDQDLFLRVFTPSNGPDPKYATAPFPPGNLSFLHGIPPIGTKFHPATELGPQGEPNHAVRGLTRGPSIFTLGRSALPVVGCGPRTADCMQTWWPERQQFRDRFAVRIRQAEQFAVCSLQSAVCSPPYPSLFRKTAASGGRIRFNE